MIKKQLIVCLLLTVNIGYAQTQVSVKTFGVTPGNSAEVNKINLQKAIDWASTVGAAIFIDPTDEPYPSLAGSF